MVSCIVEITIFLSQCWSKSRLRLKVQFVFGLICRNLQQPIATSSLSSYRRGWIKQRDRPRTKKVERSSFNVSGNPQYRLKVSPLWRNAPGGSIVTGGWYSSEPCVGNIIGSFRSKNQLSELPGSSS